MRSWKLILCLLLAVVILVGCGKTKEENSMTSDGATKAETKMAVPEKGIPVLMYHMIGDIEDNDAVLKESHLREQMKFLKDNGFHPLTLDQLYEYVMFNKPVPEKPVVITFDDGYVDTYSIVMPLMKEYGFACTVFIPTYDADQGTRLSWNQIKEMQASGMTIAGHGYHHERLAQMNEDVLNREVAMCQKELKEQLGITNEYYCYPYGSNDEASQKAMKKNGIKLAFTMNPGWVKYGDNPYALKRIWIGNAVDIENFKQRVTTEAYEDR
ncbi:MAG: polysaccharide deacetylase family protein [Megasphaera micronuciformis]|nr:polysaccharide deacetylase family protein [Megasphaera micronuciformis]